MKIKVFRFLKIVLPVSLGVYLIFHIYRQLDAGQRDALFQAMRNANYWWVALSFFMGLLSHYIRGYRWSFQLEAMGYRPKNMNNFFAVMIGYMVNMVLPRAGEVSRAAAITKYEHIPFEKSFGSIISERAVDFVLLLLITTATVLLQFNTMRPFAEELLQAFSGKASSWVLWLILGLGIVAAVVFIHLLNRYRDRAFFSLIWKLKEGLFEGLRSIARMKARGKYLFATLLIWGLYIGMFWVCFLAIDEASTLGANAVFASFVVGSFAIVVIPGGIGAFPVGIMQTLTVYGLAAETGFALGWILWLTQTAMVVLVGGISMLLMPALNRIKTTPHVQI